MVNNKKYAALSAWVTSIEGIDAAIASKSSTLGSQTSAESRMMMGFA